VSYQTAAEAETHNLKNATEIARGVEYCPEALEARSAPPT
jgi:hypothetical protein